MPQGFVFGHESKNSQEREKMKRSEQKNFFVLFYQFGTSFLGSFANEFGVSFRVSFKCQKMW